MLFANTSFSVEHGGPAVSVSQLGLALAKLDVRVGFWAPDGSALSSSVFGETDPLDITRLGGSVEDAVRHFGVPDILHDNGIWLPHNHRIARLSARVNCLRIVSVRGMLEPWAINHRKLKKRVAWRLYQKKDLRRADLLHATAESENEAIRRTGLDTPIITIPNGAETFDVQRSKGASPNTALFLSRIHPKKGLPLLIEAWANVRPQGWRLRIVGPDSVGHLAEVRALIQHYNLNELVHIEGELEGKRKLDAYADASLFILPTHSENFGIVVAEALSAGLPVITTKGAPWEELKRYKCGWWVDASVSGISNALLEATKPDAPLEEMGERGKLLVRSRYCWGQIAEQFKNTYHDLMSNGGARGFV